MILRAPYMFTLPEGTTTGVECGPTLRYAVSPQGSVGAYEALLTERERSTYEKKSAGRRREWLTGRVASKIAVEAHLGAGGVRVDAVRIEIVGQEGTPPTISLPAYACASHELLLSISHTEQIAVAAVASSETVRGIGVDIERVRPLASETVTAFLGEHEREASQVLEGEAATLDALLRWCLKEAYLKARGTGLKIHPRRIEVSFGGGDSKDITFREDGTYIPTCAFWTIHGNDYIVTYVALVR